MKLKCEGRQEEELTGLTSRSDSLEETEDRDSKRHLATEKEVTPQTNWRKWLPQTERGTLTVHWKHLATELATRRLLLSYSGAGSTELSPKTSRTLDRIWQTKSGPTGTKCRCNSPRQIKGTRTVHQETSGSRHWRDSPDRVKVLGSTLGDSWQ